MSKRLRVQVTVSYPLMVAIEVLADRNGLTVAAQAALSLRQALQRTMDGAEVQRRVRAHNAQRTLAEWQEETMTERAEELIREKAARRADEDPLSVEEPEPWQRALHDVAGEGLPQ